MRTSILKRTILPAMALALLWGCGDTVGRRLSMAHGGGPGVPVRIVLGDEGISRTIAPDHVPQVDLGDTSKYTLRLDGTSDRGGTASVPNFTLAGGAGTLLLDPGNWTLTLTATSAGSGTVLAGRTIVSAEAGTMATARITLTPQAAADGTVAVTFTLAPEVVERLDPDTSATKTVRVALYDDADQVVAGTEQDFALTYNPAQTAPYTVGYNKQVPSGRYTLRLEAPYTVQNASTKGQFVTYRYGWMDIVYVEGGRQSTASVTLAASSSMSIPGKPARRNLRTAGGNSGGNGFTNPTAFNPWGDTLWLYGADFNGPGDGNDDDGNEWLLVSWDPVYNADYYEVELLIHPFTKTGVNPATPGGKFRSVVSTDAEWDTLKGGVFTYNGTTATPTYLRFSGGEDDPDHYRSRVYETTCLNSRSNNALGKYVVCADKTLARSLFTTGGYSTGYVNSGYTMRPARDAFDTYGNYVYGGANLGKVGLEAGCSILPVLLPGFAPQMALVFRVRGVNRFGEGEWVYWKGGKW